MFKYYFNLLTGNTDKIQNELETALTKLVYVLEDRQSELGTAGDDRYNLNKLCDENADVGKITGIINGNENDKLAERTAAYQYYIGQLNGVNGVNIK